MKRVDTRILWVFMPTAMCISALWLSLSTERSLFQITICFGLMKTIEYSLRGVLTEMVSGILVFRGLHGNETKRPSMSHLRDRYTYPLTMRAASWAKRSLD
jgi:hypothetical protein